jgi:CHAT domain-containing protein
MPDRHWIETLETRADSLDKALTVSSSAYKDLKADIAMKWQDVRNVLQPGEAAIEFVHFRLFGKDGWTDTTFYCALILKKGAEAPIWIPLFEEKQLQALTKRERGRNDGGKEEQDFVYRLYSGQKGVDLYELIWLPLEKELEGVRTVYYSPSGMLHQIAFAALPQETNGRIRLQNKYDLYLVSSTREIKRLKKETPGFPQGMAAVYGGLYYDVEKDAMIAEARKNATQADEKMLFAANDVTRGGSSWAFLPGSLTEVEQICKQLENKQIPYNFYTKTSGNEESFKALSGTPAGIIHLATHGFFLEDIEKEDNREIVQRLGGENRKVFENPLLRSGLVLSGGNRVWKGEDVIEDIEDGILTADEVAKMNLIKTQLVIMSACETGLGEAKNSEGVFGLQRAFKLAGVETLIMSLWMVSDDATYKLMTTFYELWLSGKTKHEAFTEAQRQLREEKKQPFFWGAFVMLD